VHSDVLRMLKSKHSTYISVGVGGSCYNTTAVSAQAVTAKTIAPQQLSSLDAVNTTTTTNC
jgi:hypothetical protein